MSRHTKYPVSRDLLTASVLLCLASAPALAADTAKGKELLQKNCTGCHDDSVYKRSDRRVTSMSALKKQITGCEHAANANMSKSQIDDLTQYLNSTYYKFK